MGVLKPDRFEELQIESLDRSPLIHEGVDREAAIQLAEALDLYNNSRYGPSPCE